MQIDPNTGSVSTQSYDVPASNPTALTVNTNSNLGSIGSINSSGNLNAATSYGGLANSLFAGVDQSLGNTPVSPAFPAATNNIPIPHSGGLSSGTNISNTYANVNGTIYNKQTGQAFSTPAQFFTDAGVNSFNGLQFDNSWRPNSNVIPPSTNTSVTTQPNVTTNTNVLSQQPQTGFDIQAAIQSNLDTQNKFLQSVSDAYIPSPELQTAKQNAVDLQSQINQRQVDLTKSQLAVTGQGRGMTYPVIQGEQAKLAQMASLDLQGLSIQQQNALQTISNLQATQTQKLDAAKFLFTATQNQLPQTIALYKAVAPENIGTQYNPTTGDLFTVTKNPLTGQVDVTKAANIGAQKTYTSTSIQTDPNTGQLVFVGTDASGNIISQPLTGSGSGSVSGSTSSTGFQPLQGTMRTDRNNNPIAAAVTTGGTNQFTQALDQAGIKWTYGDPFPNNPGMSTIKVQGDPMAASQAILANTNAIQGWYANSTGKAVLAQYGIKNNTQFAQASPQVQQAIVQGIYKAEGGSGSLAVTPPTPQQLVASAPIGVQGSIKYLSDGTPYMDQSLLSGAQLIQAQNFKASTGIPILSTADVGKVQAIDVVKQTINEFTGLVDKSLKDGAGGKLYNLIGNNLSPIFGGTVKNDFNSYRTTAINAIQALAGGAGTGLRITSGEIATATDNLPTVNDTKSQALEKLNQLSIKLKTWTNELLPNASQLANNDPLGILK